MADWSRGATPSQSDGLRAADRDLAEQSLNAVAHDLNASAAEPFSRLRGAEHGPALAAVGGRLRAAGLLMMQHVGFACRWPGLPPVAEATNCRAVGDCFAPALHGSLELSGARLRSAARGAVRRLCAAGADATLVALVAGIEASATFYPSVTTECISLGSNLQRLSEIGGGVRCSPLVDLGAHCSRSLFNMARMSAAALREFSIAMPGKVRAGEARADAVFVGAWGSRRIDILSGLLDAVVSSRPAPPPRRLRAAEVGVFQANTSVALMSRFPSLHMLLVDPYHLHTQTAPDDQLLEEFYVSPREVFDAAVNWTRPYRSRAAFMLQESVEASRWVEPGSLDLVFIDGDHRYESVARDMEAWWPALREGGALAGHDFVLTFPGVVRAATEFAVQHEIQLFIAPEVWFFVKAGAEAAPRGAAAGGWPPVTFRRAGNCYLA
ncbi:unnamed protein product [Prorocentrum cordatum]|uniref:Class I SAM-dependent methyltransferase n=1 Tax=Prorocentrum cordatum TaxID=2364126 RepID=A0ABN9T550_9DINO|nr:unnamed protein product [Polarella glacialis]